MKKKLLIVFMFLVIMITIFISKSGLDQVISVEYTDGSLGRIYLEDLVTLPENIFYSFQSDKKIEIAKNRALEMENVFYAELEQPVYLVDVPEDINLYDEWRFDYIQMDEVWDQLDDIDYLGKTTDPIIVAVIDTGIDMDHPDLNISPDAWDSADLDDNPSDFSGHGTRVAGIIGAKMNSGNDKVVGIAPNVIILPIKIYSDNGAGGTTYLAEGIDYAINHGADIINMSLSFPSSSQLVEKALERAKKNNIILIGSTSNSSNHWESDSVYDERYKDSTSFKKVMLYPAANENVLSVGALIKHPNEDKVALADYSNISGLFDNKFVYVDVVAPGSKIASSSWIDPNKAIIKSGTSYAAPHVSGLAVLLKAKYPNLSVDEYYEIIKSTCYDPNIVIPSSYNRKDSIGHGLIDIDAAVNYTPLKSLAISNSEFSYDFKKYNYLLNVDNGIETISLSGELAEGSKLIVNGKSYSDLSNVSIELNEDITVFEVIVEKYGIERRYKFFAKYKDPIYSSKIKRLLMDSSVSSPVITEKNMDYYVTLSPSNDSVKFKVDTVSTEDTIALVTYDGTTDYIYNYEEDIIIPLTDKTIIAGLKVKDKDGNVSSHMMAFIKEQTSSGIYIPEDLEPEIITNKVTLSLDTDAIVLDYGVDAEEKYKTYNFQSTVRGADKDDVVWTLDNDKYVSVDNLGNVSIKDDVPPGLGDFSVKLKAQSVVGGAVAYADILFVEKTPLGKIEFNAPYISGYENGFFKPINIITRAEVATIFTKILNLPLTEREEKFSDVNSSHWAKDYIYAVEEIGLFSGYQDGTFKPNNAITRAEIAQVFTNYWNYSEIEVNSTHVYSIPDVDDNYWAADAIHRLYNSRVTTGYINNAYRPLDETLREELVYMVNRLIGREPYKGLDTSFKDVSMGYFYHGDIEAASRFYVKQNDIPDLDEEW